MSSEKRFSMRTNADISGLVPIFCLHALRRLQSGLRFCPPRPVFKTGPSTIGRCLETWMMSVTVMPLSPFVPPKSMRCTNSAIPSLRALVSALAPKEIYDDHVSGQHECHSTRAQRDSRRPGTGSKPEDPRLGGHKLNSMLGEIRFGVGHVLDVSG
jgi:hypothetical protein